MRSSRKIADAEWQANKAEIQKLYIKDGRPLKEVMSMLAERRKFHKNYYDTGLTLAAD